MPKKRKIAVIDETIREGMQYRGLMFSTSQRLKILEFQEKLGVNICQAGYPPAHISEERNVSELFSYGKKNKYKIRVAGLNRALPEDVSKMFNSGIKDFHLHAIITKDMIASRSLENVFQSLEKTYNAIRSNVTKSCVEISILDIGKTDISLLKELSLFLADDLKTEIISLPDTSGIMTPDIFYSTVEKIRNHIKHTETKLSVHCHNDFGMATANTIMGVMAGADVIEVSTLGIGERNGIGDLFIVGKSLKEKGFELDLKISDIDLFKEYYHYVNDICFKKTGINLLNYNTPFFGDSMKTHVAGTHLVSHFGTSSEEEFFVNVLCGKSMIKKVLEKNRIEYNEKNIGSIVRKIKAVSSEKERSLDEKEIVEIAESLS